MVFIFFVQVIARNPLGQSEATCRVVLGDIPDSPDSPSVEAMTDTDILLSWKTPARLNHAPIVCYKVQMGYIGEMTTTTGRILRFFLRLMRKILCQWTF